jgi:hypothetical protein
VAAPPGGIIFQSQPNNIENHFWLDIPDIPVRRSRAVGIQQGSDDRTGFAFPVFDCLEYIPMHDPSPCKTCGSQPAC